MEFEETRMRFEGKIIRCDCSVDDFFSLLCITLANSNHMIGKSEIVHDDNVQGWAHSVTLASYLDGLIGYEITGRVIFAILFVF